MSEHSERNAIVVGGGIGGLASALALLDRGWNVKVMDRVAAFKEVGAGLSLWPNALRALDALGLGGRVRAKAVPETEVGIRRMSGRWLSRTDTDEVARRYGPLVMIHRADFLDALRSAVPAAVVVEPCEPLTAGGETWGSGERFGIAPLADGRVYAYASASRSVGGAQRHRRAGRVARSLRPMARAHPELARRRLGGGRPSKRH